MKKNLLFLTFLASTVPLFAQTTLSGKVGNMTIDSSGNPYVISDNLTVPSGKTLTIKEGAILLFKPFTGLIIAGSLMVEGQLEKPVIFTTENDARYNPEAKQLANPFDWNGILITQKAEIVHLTNFILEYSVYGVKSQKEEFTIANGTFVHNGQFHVTIKDAIQNVVDSIPFTLTGQNTKAINLQPATDTSSNPNTTPGLRKPLSIGFVVAGLAAAGVGGYFFYSSNRYNTQYNSAVNQKRADEYATKRDAALTTAVICGIGGGVSIIGGILLYPKHPAKSKNVTIAPILGKYNGISIVLNY